MAMAIERTCSFHLMLSNDELGLLRLLAEREGLTASDYLRTLLRRDAGGASVSPLSRTRDVIHLLGSDAIEKAWKGLLSSAPRTTARTTKRTPKSPKPSKPSKRGKRP
jgi:hypothetical protein